MSFLDNCGTIVLDAILTDIGRKKMAQGKFKVSKFALGDDEIDYSLYDPTKASNTDPTDADRAILSQSCFEALSNENAVINYGLTNFVSNEVWFIPELKLNYSGSQAIDRPEEHSGFARPYGEIFYLSTNDETALKLKADLGSDNYILKSDNSIGNKIVIESGINNEDVAATENNRKNLIIEHGLLDSYLTVYVDSRLFISVMSQPHNSKFETTITGDFLYNLGPLERTVPITLPRIIDTHDPYLIKTIDNKVLYNVDTNVDDTRFSAIVETRGSAAAIGLSVENRLCGTSTTVRDPRYTKFGKTDELLFGSSNKYDYIDTTVYVVGASSNAQISIPVRVVRYTGT